MCPSYLDGDQALLTKRPVIPVGWQPIVAIGCQLAWLCSFQGPRKALRPVWAIGLSKLNSMLGLELRDLRHHAKARWDISVETSGWAGQVRSTC